MEFGGYDTMPTTTRYVHYSGHPSYWVPNRTSYSRLLLPSPPFDWWAQRDA